MIPACFAKAKPAHTLSAPLSATFGTLTEIFILFNLLRQGQIAVMQSEITGSVLLGLLFIIGLSQIAGGIKHGFQAFDVRDVVRVNPGDCHRFSGGGCFAHRQRWHFELV